MRIYGDEDGRAVFLARCAEEEKKRSMTAMIQETYPIIDEGKGKYITLSNRDLFAYIAGEENWILGKMRGSRRALKKYFTKNELRQRDFLDAVWILRV